MEIRLWKRIGDTSHNTIRFKIEDLLLGNISRYRRKLTYVNAKHLNIALGGSCLTPKDKE